MVAVGDRVRITRYWPGVEATVTGLPTGDEDISFSDHFHLTADNGDSGLFEPSAFEPVNSLATPESPTLRDQFAMAALSGLLSRPPGTYRLDRVYREAYQHADAMLKERAK